MLATTAEDLWSLPDDGLRHELVERELRVMVPPGAEHGRVAATVGGLLFGHARRTGAGNLRLQRSPGLKTGVT